MLLRYSFKMIEESDAIKEAVNLTLQEGIVTEDLNADHPYSTEEVGDKIASLVWTQRKIHA
jgi:3-isopropylmalate dehydrogenase